MSNTVDLQTVEKDARRASNQDGLVYLLLGLLMALVGLSLWDSHLAIFAGLAPLLIFVVEPIRRHITYPRIGFVQFSIPEGFGKGLLKFAAAAVVILLVVAFAFNGRFQLFLPIFIAVVFALSLYFGTSMSGIRVRDWVAIGLMLVSGVVVVFVFDDWHQATAVQMWITAGLLILYGIVDLVRFLRLPKLAVENGETDGNTN